MIGQNLLYDIKTTGNDVAMRLHPREERQVGEMSSTPVTEQVEDSILVVTIDRREAMNTIDQSTAEGIDAAIERFEKSPELRVAVLTGADGVFCAGLDLKAVRERGLEKSSQTLGTLAHVDERGFAGITRRPPEKPIIAAVEGPAVAGGLEIALSCDLITAGKGARFGLTEVKVGLIAGAGGLLRLSQRIPRAVALEIALTGELISSQRAYEIGLVNRVVEDGKALTAALDYAKLIARGSPLAVSRSKRVLEDAATWPAEERWQRQQPFLDEVFTSPDAAEGIAAFLERRDPKWAPAINRHATAPND